MNESAREAGRLDGWKAIAAYLGKDSARTAQRYEREFGLPVHRLSLKGGDTVYAFKAELDEWQNVRDGLASKKTPAQPESHATPAPPQARRVASWRWALLLAPVLALLVWHYAIRPALGVPKCYVPPAGVIVIAANNPLVPSSLANRVYVLSHDHSAVIGYDRTQKDSSGELKTVAEFIAADFGRIEKIAVTADSRRIFAADSRSGRLLVFDATEGNLDKGQIAFNGHVEIDRTVGALSLTGDGRKLYVGVESPGTLGRIEVFEGVNQPDLFRVKQVATIRGVGCPTDLFAPASSPRLFVATQCGGGKDPLYVIDTRTDRIIAKLPGFAAGSKVVATPDASTVYISFGLYGEYHVAAVSHYLESQPQVLSIVDNAGPEMALTPDARTLFVGAAIGKGLFLDLGTKGRFPVPSVDAGKKPIGSAILSFNVQSGKMCGGEPTWLPSYPTGIAIGQDGTLIVVVEDGGLFFADAGALECK
jgi:DNA-binding beta-propeller fold protein YncE